MRLRSDLIRSFKLLLLNPRFKITATHFAILKLGSNHGGWSFIDEKDLKGAVVISAGLGEDASFDVEIASMYGMKVLIIDPTPRAIKHFNEMTTQFSKHATKDYSLGGHQDVQAYEMGSLDSHNFDFIPKALWNEKTKLRFFEPQDPSHVSHSIINFQKSYSTETTYIEVESIRLIDVFEYFKIQRIPLFKLDIEGAEIEVLKEMLLSRIYPNQILVEYDELNYPSLIGRKRVLGCHRDLISNNYELVHRDSPSNFLYLLKSD